MTLTEEQKNNILRNMVSVEVKRNKYSHTPDKDYQIKLTSGSELIVKRFFTWDLRQVVSSTILLTYDDYSVDIIDCEDLAEALIYQIIMDEKEAYLEEQRQEQIKFESIVNSIGKEPTITFDKVNCSTPLKTPEFEGELVSDVSLTFWQRVWNNIKNYDKGIGGNV